MSSALSQGVSPAPSHPRARAGGQSFLPLAILVALAASASACQPTLDQVVGVVRDVDSPSLGRVNSFDLLLSDGRILTFDTSELPFRPEFPAVHLSEHQALGDPIEVTYRRSGDRLLVTDLDDA